MTFMFVNISFKSVPILSRDLKDEKLGILLKFKFLKFFTLNQTFFRLLSFRFLDCKVKVARGDKSLTDPKTFHEIVKLIS